MISRSTPPCLVVLQFFCFPFDRNISPFVTIKSQFGVVILAEERKIYRLVKTTFESSAFGGMERTFNRFLQLGYRNSF